jgi:hypothetical protein
MQFITMLKDFEAVVSGNTMVIQLPANRVWDIDGKRIETRYSSVSPQYSVAIDAVISQVTPAQRTLVKYTLDGVDITLEQMRGHRRAWDDGDCYPDLETEFEHRKLLAELDKAVGVYEETPELLTPIEYKVVGEFTDTGSKFIETPLTYGKGRFYPNDTSFFKLNVTGLLGDTLRQFAKERGFSFENSTHSGYRYAKIDNTYVSTKEWEKKLEENSTQYYPTLSAAIGAEQTLVAELRQMLNSRFNYSKLEGLLCSDVFKELEYLLGRVSALEVKAKSESSHRAVIVNIKQLMTKLGEK